jgi:hypothetical protein
MRAADTVEPVEIARQIVGLAQGQHDISPEPDWTAGMISKAIEGSAPGDLVDAWTPGGDKSSDTGIHIIACHM